MTHWLQDGVAVVQKFFALKLWPRLSLALLSLPPVLSLTFDTQAAMADDPALSAIREFSLSLDVPQIAREDQPFEQLRDADVNADLVDDKVVFVASREYNPVDGNGIIQIRAADV